MASLIRRLTPLGMHSEYASKLIPIGLASTAVAALLLGTAVYLLDRDWASSSFLAPFVDYQWPRSAVFGAVGGFLPALLHAYAISVLIIIALWPWPRARAWVWSLWFIIASTLELLQSGSGNAWLLVLERPIGGGGIVGYLKSYALQGQFDSLDMLAAGIGCFAALAVTVAAQRSLKRA